MKSTSRSGEATPEGPAKAQSGRPRADASAATRETDHAIAKWRDIENVLAPIIGQRGVAALYRRSLFLTRNSHPWLAAVYEDSLQPGDYTILRAALVQHANRKAANAALMQTFCSLLSSMIGESLTQRLLRTVTHRTHDVATEGEASP